MMRVKINNFNNFNSIITRPFENRTFLNFVFWHNFRPKLASLLPKKNPTSCSTGSWNRLKTFLVTFGTQVGLDYWLLLLKYKTVNANLRFSFSNHNTRHKIFIYLFKCFSWSLSILTFFSPPTKCFHTSEMTKSSKA